MKFFSSSFKSFHNLTMIFVSKESKTFKWLKISPRSPYYAMHVGLGKPTADDSPDYKINW